MKLRREKMERRGVLLGMITLVLSCGLIAGATAWANELTLRDAVFQKIEKQDAQTVRKMVSIEQEKPGEDVSYVMTYTNMGDKPVRDIVLVAPVPKQLEYISTSIIKTGGVNTASFEVSVDGGAHYGPLPQLMVTPPGGEPRRAKAYDVTHVRWSLASSVAAEEDLTILLRGRVRAQDPVTPSP